MGDESSTNFHFQFTYTVDGTEYHGDSEGDFIGYHSSFQRGEKKKGDAVTILYNPENPGENCASRTGFYTGVFLAVFGQLFLALAIKLIRDLNS